MEKEISTVELVKSLSKDSKLSGAEIARRAGVSRERVRQIFQALKITPARKKVKERNKNIVAAGKDKVPIKEIMDKFTVSRSIVVSLFKNAGIEYQVEPTKRKGSRKKKNVERNKKILKMLKNKTVAEVSEETKLSVSIITRIRLEGGKAVFDPLESKKSERFITVYRRHVLNDEPALTIKNDLNISESQFRYALRTGADIFNRHPDLKKEMELSVAKTKH